jgi:hypothetical protein
MSDVAPNDDDQNTTTRGELLAASTIVQLRRPSLCFITNAGYRRTPKTLVGSTPSGSKSPAA